MTNFMNVKQESLFWGNRIQQWPSEGSVGTWPFMVTFLHFQTYKGNNIALHHVSKLMTDE